MPSYKTPSHKIFLDLCGEMVLKMDLKEARGLWVDGQIFELQSQMAMVHRFLVKLGKVTSIDERNSYCHSMPPTEQGMSRSLSNESEIFGGIEPFSCPHEEGVEGHSSLFHDEYEPSLISDLFDPSSPPIFDSFELKYGDVNSGIEQDSSDQNMDEMSLFNSVASQDELLRASAAIGSYFHTQAGPQRYSIGPRSNISSTKGQEQSRSNSFKNCFVFKRGGLHSVQVLIKGADFKPGVHIDPGVGDIVIDNTQNLLIAPYNAQSELTHFVPKTSAFKGPQTHGPRLLDFYIEDDELKDVEEIMLVKSSRA